MPTTLLSSYLLNKNEQDTASVTAKLKLKLFLYSPGCSLKAFIFVTIFQIGPVPNLNVERWCAKYSRCTTSNR